MSAAAITPETLGGAPVGYYCNHADEPWDARTHKVRTMKRGKLVVVAASETVQSLSFGDYVDGERVPPACPKARPVAVIA